MKEQLELRKMLKKKKPKFLRQDAHKKKRLEPKWRKPKGSDSKMRQCLKGYRKLVREGYKGPKQVRGLSPSGLMPVLISNISQLSPVDKERQGVVITAGVGKRKKVDIVKKAVELKLNLLNVKEPAKFLENVEKELKQRKEKAKKAEEKKPEAKKPVKKEKLEKVLTEEEKKEFEKKEKDKLLVTRK